MGLNLKTINDTSSVSSGLIVTKQPSDYIIALAGNPNVGKSTLFNLLTKMKQHTGNWPGKTVCCAQGRHISNGSGYVFVDLPGTYSLMAHSNEEEVARDFICFGGADATVVVCDATCLERNLNLVLQTIEITKRVVVCINLMDEAKKKNIHIDLDLLEKNLGVPVVSISARNGDGVHLLITKLYDVINNPVKAVEPKYIAPIENAISMIEPTLKPLLQDKISSRFTAIKLLCRDIPILTTIEEHIPTKIVENNEIQACAEIAFKQLEESGISIDLLPDKIASCLVLTAEGDCCDVVSCDTCKKQCRDRKLDKILTSRITGIPIMLGLLALVLWITITGANVPSQLLSTALFWVQDRLTDFFHYINAPDWLHGMLVLGVYHVLAWVVSVMLPPMAIFFPLFTILEDFGYLPRVAFNLDHSFKKANTCGKQSLTMCMGFINL